MNNTFEFTKYSYLGAHCGVPACTAPGAWGRPNSRGYIMNISATSRVRIAGALLFASTAMAIAAPAHADSTAECNAENGTDGPANTDDDNLECGVDASATGANSTALGNDATVNGDRSVAMGDNASATGTGNTAVG